VSVSTAGPQGNGLSEQPQISSDGGYVVFESTATNLVGDDTFGARDIFLRDLANDTTTRISVKADGTEANGNNTYPSVSDDGQFIAFASAGSGAFIDTDTNGSGDIYVVERTPSLTVTKVVVNDNGGTAVEGDFNLYVDGVPITSGDATTTLAAGSYTITEDANSAYEGTFSGDCDADGDITLGLGEYTCTLTNDDIPSEATLTVDVTNNNDGILAAGDVTLTLDGDAVTNGVASTTAGGAHSFSYVLPEDSGSRYNATWGGDCAPDGSLTTVLGGTYACTLSLEDTGASSSGGGGSSHKKPLANVTLPPQASDTAHVKIAELQQKLIELLTQLLAELMKGR
jgi:hypothetical protein